MYRLALALVLCGASLANADPEEQIRIDVGGSLIIPLRVWSDVSGIGGCPVGDFEYGLVEHLAVLATVGGCGHTSIDYGPGSVSTAGTSEAYLLGGVAWHPISRVRLFAMLGVGTFNLKISSPMTETGNFAAPAWVGATFSASRMLRVGVGVFSPDLVFGGLHSLTNATTGQISERVSVGIAATLTFRVWGWSPEPARPPPAAAPAPAPPPPPAPAPAPAPIAPAPPS